MSCLLCASGNHGEFGSEIVIHFRGPQKSGQTHRLVIPEAIGLLGLRLFAVYYPGCNGTGCGVVFKLTPNSNGGWHETLLHVFADHPGAYPTTGLTFRRGRKSLRHNVWGRQQDVWIGV
jgi:hypothetical protein